MEVQDILNNIEIKDSLEESDYKQLESDKDKKILLLNPHAYDSYPKYLKFLKRVSDGTLSNVAKLIGDIHPISCGYTYDERMWVMPNKGPGLIEGERIPHHNYIIEKIHYDSENSYYVLELKEIENN